ncbi:hypothetical protein ACTXT7_006350 [Hymenolepis weldensis]
MNQQKSVENSSVNQISGEEISELQLNADSAMICITSDFVRLNLSPPICVSNEDIRRQCAEHKQEPKKKSARRKAKSIVNQVTDSIVSLKRDMKRNENSQRNSHERIPITSRKKEKKRKQHLELVPAIVKETKPKSIMKTAERTENGDLPLKPKTNDIVAIFNFSPVNVNKYTLPFLSPLSINPAQRCPVFSLYPDIVM